MQWFYWSGSSWHESGLYVAHAVKWDNPALKICCCSVKGWQPKGHWDQLSVRCAYHWCVCAFFLCLSVIKEHCFALYCIRTQSMNIMYCIDPARHTNRQTHMVSCYDVITHVIGSYLMHIAWRPPVMWTSSHTAHIGSWSYWLFGAWCHSQRTGLCS